MMLHTLINLMGSTAGGGAATFAWNPADKSSGFTLSSSDQSATATGSSFETVRTVQGWTTASGVKEYWEVEVDQAIASDIFIGLLTAAGTITSGTQHSAIGGGARCSWRNDGTFVGAGGWTAAGSSASFTAGDRLMFAIDTAGGKFFKGKNGTWLNSSDPAAGTNANFTTMPAGTFRFFLGTDNNAGTDQVSIIPPGSHSFSTPSGFTAIG